MSKTGFLIVFLLLVEISSSSTDKFLPEIVEKNLFDLAAKVFHQKYSLSQNLFRQPRNRPGLFQSLTLLMNFRDDGMTSFQIYRGNDIVYMDNGICRHGQMFDPSTGRCRDVFCQELNAIFNGTTCASIDNKTSANSEFRMNDIDIVLPATINVTDVSERVNYSIRLNSRMNHTCLDDWDNLLQETLKSYVQVDANRFQKIRICPRENVSSQQQRIQCAEPMSQSLMRKSLETNKHIDVDIYLSITDRFETSESFLTNFLITSYLSFGANYSGSVDMCRNYSVKIHSVSVVSDRNRARQEFCPPPSTMVTTFDARLKHHYGANGSLSFVVQVPEEETTYELGDFTYVVLVSAAEQARSNDGSDVTIDSTSLQLFNVCNRYPRIVGRCPDGQVMRIAMCEFVQYKNNSIRMKRTGKLYTNKEYRYDEFRPDLYVVVCKQPINNSTSQAKIYGFLDKAPGFLSTIASILSIFALTITLLTFALFSSLRNLPGCNTINLIIALIFAQILFLCQSLFIMTRSSVCLMFAIGIHYFYLASFFWMNVMAFDLWKTFHKGFSLYLYDIRERLPFYSAYAWGMPILFVLLGIILDAANAPMKPCYGRYFRGCYDVCFRTKADMPLQGCWIESALMRFILFGFPVAVILFVNFIFYVWTVRSIRRNIKNLRVQVDRKFQRKKQVVPGEHDAKIYMRMAALAGFGWTIGFLLLLLHDDEDGFKRYLSAIFQCLFILLNATPGLFIFAVYVCNRRVLNLYRILFRRICKFCCEKTDTCRMFSFDKTKSAIQRVRHVFERPENNKIVVTSISNRVDSMQSITSLSLPTESKQLSPEQSVQSEQSFAY